MVVGHRTAKCLILLYFVIKMIPYTLYGDFGFKHKQNGKKNGKERSPGKYKKKLFTLKCEMNFDMNCQKVY